MTDKHKRTFEATLESLDCVTDSVDASHQQNLKDAKQMLIYFKKQCDFLQENLHSSYGPCDGLLDGNCSECASRLDTLKTMAHVTVRELIIKLTENESTMDNDEILTFPGKIVIIPKGKDTIRKEIVIDTRKG